MSLKLRLTINTLLSFLIMFLIATPSYAWFNKTHLAIAKAAGYKNWYNAAAADIARLKAGDIENLNHYVNNRKGVTITAETVQAQVKKYDNPRDRKGHLYGALVASLRNYLEDKKQGRFLENHMAYCVHYVGDLSMPLHNTEYSPFNKKFHMEMDGVIEDEVLDNLSKIRITKITIKTEKDLLNEIAHIAGISMELGFRLDREERMMTREEAYRQVGYSASLLKAILEFVDSH